MTIKNAKNMYQETQEVRRAGDAEAEAIVSERCPEVIEMLMAAAEKAKNEGDFDAHIAPDDRVIEDKIRRYWPEIKRFLKSNGYAAGYLQDTKIGDKRYSTYMWIEWFQSNWEDTLD